MQVNTRRLLENIERYAQIGKKGAIGVERIALSNEDKQTRDLLHAQMINAGLEVHIDRLGNMIGMRKGKTSGPAVATGSHLDTVYSGGRYDGALGVLAGLEAIQTLNDNGVETDKPIALVNFTNEEGVRFAPDMMGSHVYAGLADLDDIIASPAYDNPAETIGSRLAEIGYNGDLKPGSIPFDSFFELHIEQGPVLEEEKIAIGVVDMVQGIYWTRYRLSGQANHAGTTPLAYRKDTGYLAGELIHYLGNYSRRDGSKVLTTVGEISLEPNTINIVPERAVFTLDLRSTDAGVLMAVQKEIDDHISARCAEAGITLEQQVMVRFQPVVFSKVMADIVERSARRLGLSTKRMPSGAGHDAQMMASFCPSTMIFVPSVKGISHNVEEYSLDRDVGNGTQVLMECLLSKSMAFH